MIMEYQNKFNKLYIVNIKTDDNKNNKFVRQSTQSTI